MAEQTIDCDVATIIDQQGDYLTVEFDETADSSDTAYVAGVMIGRGYELLAVRFEENQIRFERSD